MVKVCIKKITQSVKVDDVIDTRDARTQSRDNATTGHHGRVHIAGAGCLSKVQSQQSMVGLAVSYWKL